MIPTKMHTSSIEYTFKVADAIKSMLQGPARILVADNDQQTSAELKPLGQQSGFAPDNSDDAGQPAGDACPSNFKRVSPRREGAAILLFAF